MASQSRTVSGTDRGPSSQRVALIAGVFYLLVGIFGAISEGFVDLKMYVPGDAAAAAANIAGDPDLVRLSVIAHLLDATFFVLTAMALYLLFRSTHEAMARAMLVLASVAVGIIALNAVFQFESLRVATNPSYAAAFGAAGSNALVLLLLEIQHYGTLAAQVFFGLWLAPMGYLAYRSGLFPKGLGVVLVIATVTYLADLLAAFVAPDLERQLKPTVFMGAIAEGWMVLYLLFRGIRGWSHARPRPAPSLAPAEV